jgi:peptidoglycan LD-endopeptidase CwlK
MPCLSIADNLMTFDEAIAGTKAPRSVIEHLCLVNAAYRSFEGGRYQGQLIVHEAVREDIIDIFALMEQVGFPMARVIPIVRYGWSDDASMADNNTSAFNYRFVMGTERLSAHARGLAIDINPLLNPVIYEDGHISPPGACYLPGAEGVLDLGNPVVMEFLKRGWQWGGLFDTFHDYHHFERQIP